MTKATTIADPGKAKTKVKTKNSQPHFSPLKGPASLMVAEPNDRFEKEADRFAADVLTATSANQVVGMPSVVTSNQKELFNKQGRFFNPHPDPSHRRHQQVLLNELAQSNGHALDDHTQAFMSSRLGAGFSNVRIHRDSKAQELVAGLGARAFTYGNHIFFGRGQYQPDTLPGKYLLTHELVHTLQQRGSHQLIQRKPDKSLVDDPAFGDLIGKTPALAVILNSHKKNTPANKAFATLADQLLVLYNQSPDKLWEEIQKLAEAKTVVPKGDAEMDLFFDVYKFLKKYSEAKVLSTVKKYLPQKTAFYDADFYKQVLMDDLGWLPHHPAIKELFPSRLLDTYHMYLWGPVTKVISLEGKEKLVKKGEEELDKLANGKGLADNERTAIAIIALLRLDHLRYDGLVKDDDQLNRQMSGSLGVKKALADIYSSPDWLNSIDEKSPFREIIFLFKNIAPGIQRIAVNVIEFWDKAVQGLGAVNKALYLQSLRQSFKKFDAEFKKNKLAAKLKKAAQTFLQLSPTGDLPDQGQLNRQKETAAKAFRQVIADSGLELIRLQRKQQQPGKAELASLYGLLIVYIYKLQSFLAKTTTQTKTRDAEIIERIEFGGWLADLGRLVNDPNLTQVGEEAIAPTNQPLTGTAQRKSLFGFGDSIEWAFEPLGPQQTFTKFNTETKVINDSSALATLMKYFFYSALMKKEIEKLQAELNAGENKLVYANLADYKPIPKRVDEWMDQLSASDASVIPRRFVLKDVHFSVIPADWNNFGEPLYGDKTDTRFRDIYNRKFPNDVWFIPQNAQFHYDANGIVVWVVTGAAFKEFVSTIHQLYPEIVLTADISQSPFDWFLQLGTWLHEKEPKDGQPSPSEKELTALTSKAKQHFINDNESILFPLRRRALSHHRRVLLKYFLKPLWQNYEENTAHISSWGNPDKFIGMITYLAGGHPWTFAKIEGKDEQAELKIQIATVMLELGPLIYERLLNAGPLGHAKTGKIDVVARLLPHILGALSLQQQVLDNRATLHPGFSVGEHGERVEKLKKLKDGLLGVLKDYYDTQVIDLRNYESGLLPQFDKALPKQKIYVGDWLKGDASQANNPVLEDRSSNIPFTRTTPISSDGKTYQLEKVYQSFYYRPAIALDAGSVSWDADMLLDANPSTLILKDGEEERQVERRDRQGKVKLFTYKIISPNGSFLTVDVFDRDDVKLKNMRSIIAVRSNIENLKTLGEVLETGAQWMTVPFYFIPGLGEAVLAGDIVMGVVQFISGPEFRILMDILNGDGIGLLTESFNRVTGLFHIDKLWDTLLDPDLELPAIQEPQMKSSSEETVKKSDGKLKKVLMALKRVGIKIWNGLVRLKGMVNMSIREIRAFLLNRPTLASIVTFITDHFFLIMSAVETVEELMEEKPAEEDSMPFSAEIQEMLNHLQHLQVPLNLVPLDAIIDIIVRLALKALKGPKGVIAQSVKSLLEATGIYQKILDIVKEPIEGSWADPNVYLNKLINGQIQPLVQQAGNEMAGGLNDVLEKIPGFKKSPKAVAPTIDKFEGSEDNYENEKDAEVQPFAAGHAQLSGNPGLPAHPLGGDPINQTQAKGLSKEYGQDFSHVRLHTDATAEQATTVTGAEALTTGSHVYLRPGLSLSQDQGRQILKHELAHVIQQTGLRPDTSVHTNQPIDGKPGKGVVVDGQKEAQADAFAAGGSANGNELFSNGELDEGIHPKLTDLALKFFSNVSKDSFEAKKAHLFSHARRTQEEDKLAASIPSTLKAAIKKMKFSKKMRAGSEEIMQYCQGQDWSAIDFREIVRVSKVKKKIGKEDSDESNWQLKPERLRIGLEESIAIQSGIMFEIQLELSGSLLEIKSLQANNIFVERVRTSTNIWQKLIDNSFPGGLKPRAGQKNQLVTDIGIITAETKKVIKALEITNVFAGEGFKFTDYVIRQVQQQVYPDLEGLMTGDKNDAESAIPINWYKNTRKDYPQKITLPRSPGKKEFNMFPSSPATVLYNGDPIEVGVKSENIIRAAGGVNSRSNASIVKRGSVNARDSGATKRYREAMNYFGYPMKEEDVDHVLDLGFGGTNDYDNFWPLRSDINRIAYEDQWYARYKVEYKKDKGRERLIDSIQDLRGKWFIIKGYNHEIERPGGRWTKV